MDKNLIFLGISFVAHMEVDYVLVQGKAFSRRIRFLKKGKSILLWSYRIYNASWITSKLQICDKLWLYVTLVFNHNDGINCLKGEFQKKILMTSNEGINNPLIT